MPRRGAPWIAQDLLENAIIRLTLGPSHWGGMTCRTHGESGGEGGWSDRDRIFLESWVLPPLHDLLRYMKREATCHEIKGHHPVSYEAREIYKDLNLDGR